MLHFCTRIAPSATLPFRRGLRILPARHYSIAPSFGLARSKAMVGERVLKVMANTTVATTLAVAGPLLVKRPVVACEDQKPRLPPRLVQSDATKTEVVHKDEIAFGTVLGVCAGYFIKKIGKIFVFMIGLGFVCLQYLSAKSYVTVHWDRMAQAYNREFEVDKDGRVTTRDINTKWRAFVRFLTHGLQFKSTFLLGLYAGIRYG